MDFKLNGWVRKKRIELYFSSNQIKSKGLAIKAAISAVLFGCLIGIIIICMNGYNGFSFFFKIFEYAFNNTATNGSETMMQQTFMYFCSYFLIGLGISLGFKLGIFNMGGSGQAVLGMAFASHLLFAESDRHFSSAYAIVIILIFVLSGVLISTLAGVLKAYLNVHEVVTTIMLNWVVWYFFKWFDRNIFTEEGPMGTPDMKNGTVQNYTEWFNIGGNPVAFGIIMVVISIAVTWVVMNLTTAGYKFKVVGTQKTAADYAGIKYKLYIVVTMALQGLLIGLGSFIYYFQFKGRIETIPNTVPTIGFDALTIPLIAFNNVFGMIPVALLWACIQTGVGGALFEFMGLQRETGSLLFGFIIYGAAIYALFLKLKPIEWIKMYLAIRWDWVAKKEVKEIKNKIILEKIKIKFYKYDPELIEMKKTYIDKKNNVEKDKKSVNYEVSMNELRKIKQILKLEIKSKKETSIKIIKNLRRDIRLVNKSSLDSYKLSNKSHLFLNKFGKNKISLYITLDEITRKKVEKTNLVEIEKLKLKNYSNDLENKNNIKEEIKNNINKINESYKVIYDEIIDKYKQEVTKRKIVYLENKVKVNEEYKNYKNTYQVNVLPHKNEFVNLIKTEKANVKKIQRSYKLNIKDIKKQLDTNTLNKNMWDLRNSYIAEMSRAFVDISNNEYYVKKVAYQKEGMEVVKKYELS